jgi:HAT1-interacting factor 1
VLFSPDDIVPDRLVQVEELKTSPSESLEATAPALAAQALDKELNAAQSSSLPSQIVVNDLTSMVKKKKIPEDSSATKRKAYDDAEASSTEKKARLDTPPS